jgi:hypothetical protein
MIKMIWFLRDLNLHQIKLLKLFGGYLKASKPITQLPIYNLRVRRYQKGLANAAFIQSIEHFSTTLHLSCFCAKRISVM